MTHRKTRVIGVASGYGAGDHDCQDGPDVLRSFDFLQDLNDANQAFQWGDVLHLTEKSSSALSAVHDISVQLANTIEQCLDAEEFPLVIGGDHSCAIGTWSGTVAHLKKSHNQSRMGLIWIDAHMDSHTPSTSPSQNIHGMPLACLLGFGDAELTEISGIYPKLQPSDICLIGVRSFEWGEAALLRNLGVRVYFMDEIHRRGMDAVLEEARSHVCKSTLGYGISFDLDALDPADQPGVGTPTPNGLMREEVTNALAKLRGDQKLLALEIVEYNPYRDLQFKTAEAVHDLCQSLI